VDDPAFGESEAHGVRDVLEGRFVCLAMCALRLGVNVVMDFGVWAKDERSALRHLAGEAGAKCALIYLPIEDVEQRARQAGGRREQARLELGAVGGQRITVSFNAIGLIELL
jgi:predicted kinase